MDSLAPENAQFSQKQSSLPPAGHRRRLWKRRAGGGVIGAVAIAQLLGQGEL
jgi:hypothetical protein